MKGYKLVPIEPTQEMMEVGDWHCNGASCGATVWDAMLEKAPNADLAYVLYGYATPTGKLYASGMDAIANGEQSWVKVYVNKEDLK